MELIGITKIEFKVYETLLRHGAQTISGLSRKAGMDQRSVYDYIERLIHKGLVGEMLHNNKRLFLGLNPDTLSHIIDDQKDNVSKDIEKYAKIAESEEFHVNFLNSFVDFFSVIKTLGTDVKAIIGDKIIIQTPAFIHFLRKSRVRIIGDTTRKMVMLFSDDVFLIFSTADKCGFFVRNKDFAKNMRVYFS